MTLAFLILYLAAMLALGALNVRRADSADGFFVAARQGSPSLVAASLLATIVGASATTGMAARAFTDGLPAAWWLLVGVPGLLLLAFVFAKRVRDTGVFTLPELLEQQYGGPIKQVASAAIVLAWLGVIAAQLVGSAAVLRHVLGSSGDGWLWAVAIVLVAYTASGGQRSVLRTDAWQLGMLLCGLFVALLGGLRQVGGVAGLRASLPPELLQFPVNEAMPAGKVASWLVTIGLMYTVGPDMVSRLLCARSGQAAKQAAGMAGLALVPIAFCVAGLGLVAKVVAPDGPANQALLASLDATLPAWAMGWMAAALLAAMMSSGSTCLLTAATILVVDVRGRPADGTDLVRQTRWAILAVGLLATLVALWRADIIGSLMFAYSIYAGGVVVPVMLGFWRKELRLTSGGALAAVIVGGGVALRGAMTHHDWAVAAIGSSALVLLLSRRWRSLA